MDGGGADDDLEQHAGHADRDTGGGEEEVFEQDAEREQDYSQRWDGVEAGERRCEERRG